MRSQRCERGRGSYEGKEWIAGIRGGYSERKQKEALKKCTGRERRGRWKEKETSEGRELVDRKKGECGGR